MYKTFLKLRDLYKMLIVHKYGGTSVANLDRIKNIAIKIKKIKNKNSNIIIVVSAMSGDTNRLIGYADFFSKNIRTREKDILLSSGETITASLLSIALESYGLKSIAFTGKDAGIITDNNHTYARIKSINKENINLKLKDGYIVVVAGFQGVNEAGDITTLGRGGSDLSAVALAGALKADVCEIYSDVDGIYTTDPRIEPKAKKIDFISYDEMLELSSLGAKVLQSRSVELAKKFKLKLVAKNSFSNSNGTIIGEKSNNMENISVVGIALDKNQARVSLREVSDKPGIAAEIFQKLADENINVDMIIQNASQNKKTNLGFTVPEDQLNRAKIIIDLFDHDIGSVDFNNKISKVSIIGVGMKSHVGIAAKVFSTLAENNINIEMISTSEIKISIIVDDKLSTLAVQKLHQVYNLDK